MALANTLYISRRLGLSPAEAVVALDRWHREVADLKVTTPSRLAYGGLKFRSFRDAACPEPRSLRSFYASVRVFGQTVPLEVELLKWSEECSELGVRPLRTRWPVMTARYTHAAAQAIELLADQLLAPHVSKALNNMVPSSTAGALVAPSCRLPAIVDFRQRSLR